jgi:hypothetical protein
MVQQRKETGPEDRNVIPKHAAHLLTGQKKNKLVRSRSFEPVQ